MTAGDAAIARLVAERDAALKRVAKLEARLEKAQDLLAEAVLRLVKQDNAAQREDAHG